MTIRATRAAHRDPQYPGRQEAFGGSTENYPWMASDEEDQSPNDADGYAKTSPPFKSFRDEFLGDDTSDADATYCGSRLDIARNRA